MDTATVRAFIQIIDSIEEVRAGGNKVAQQTIDTLELLANKHAAFEEVTASTLAVIRDMLTTLTEESMTVRLRVNKLEHETVDRDRALEARVAKLEEAAAKAHPSVYPPRGLENY